VKPLIAPILVGLLVSGFAGCAPSMRTEGAPASAEVVSPEQVQMLRERAAAYWAARMAGDDKLQWELLEPRGKGRLTWQEYAAERRGVRYLGYQIEDATIEGYFATVKVRLLFQPVLQRMVSIPIQTVLMDDQWVKVGGTWFRQFDDRRLQRPEP
jgi:hypothetical protein